MSAIGNRPSNPSRSRRGDTPLSGTAEADLRGEMRAEANRVFIDAEYSGRQHMLMGQWWRRRQTWIGLPVAVATGIASALAAISALLGWGAAATTILGFIGAIAAAFNLFFRPEAQAQSHSSKGVQLIALRNEARRFMNLDLNTALSDDALLDRVRSIGERYDELRATQPVNLPEWAYVRVKQQIDAGNYDYESDRLWRG